MQKRNPLLSPFREPSLRSRMTRKGGGFSLAHYNTNQQRKQYLCRNSFVGATFGRPFWFCGCLRAIKDRPYGKHPCENQPKLCYFSTGTPHPPLSRSPVPHGNPQNSLHSFRGTPTTGEGFFTVHFGYMGEAGANHLKRVLPAPFRDDSRRSFSSLSFLSVAKNPEEKLLARG